MVWKNWQLKRNIGTSKGYKMIEKWKIKSSHYYSHNQERRDLEFNLTGVTIITGESSTGKSAVIDTVNYCLGSSDCDIGKFIEDRCSHVGILLTNGLEEIFICRKMPLPGQRASGKMLVLHDKLVDIPKCSDEIILKVNKDSALLKVQAVLGIGEIDKAGQNGSKVSIRNCIPYNFLNDEVIISKRQSLYGLDGKKSRHVIDSYPYFIGAITEKTLGLERELFSLKKGVEHEEKRQDRLVKEHSQAEKDADSILFEAINLGVIEKETVEFSLDEKLELLKTINHHTFKKPPSKSNSLFDDLTKQKRKKLKLLGELEKELEASKNLSVTSDNFIKALSSQKSNLEVVGFFKESYESTNCPLCESHLEQSNAVISKVSSTYEAVMEEVGLAETRVPKIENYIDELSNEINQLKDEIGDLEDKLKVIVNNNEQLSLLEDRYVFIERLKGKITLFLLQQNRNSTPVLQSNKLKEYLARIKEIESGLNPVLIEEQIKAADNEVSQHATDYLQRLPTSVPCKGNKVHFSSKYMSLSILQGNGSLIPLNKIKSDQNYLALHVSLILGLQKEFQSRKRPIPSFIFVDQVSRPYYPADVNSKFKKEIKLKVNSEDKEVESVKAYFDLFFDVTDSNTDLQIIVLEHAYFENFERYKKSVKYRWTEETEEKLIPESWPIYSDL